MKEKNISLVGMKSPSDIPSVRKSGLTIYTPERWEDYLKLINGPLKNWAYRGHANASWELESTLSRELRNRNIQKRYWTQQEYRIIWIFQRKASHFVEEAPHVTDTMHWLALMQHHGAPTRLLDFTWSAYVAAFFALEPSTGDAAVWAVNTPKTGTFYFPPVFSSHKHRVSHPKDVLRKYCPGNRNGVVFGEPFFKNQRLVAQSGTFACPINITKTIDQVLDQRENVIAKVVLGGKELRREALHELYSMNITNATLFPDLDGLCRSLRFELEYEWRFNPTADPIK
jgi:FRG domain